VDFRGKIRALFFSLLSHSNPPTLPPSSSSNTTTTPYISKHQPFLLFPSLHSLSLPYTSTIKVRPSLSLYCNVYLSFVPDSSILNTFVERSSSNFPTLTIFTALLLLLLDLCLTLVRFHHCQILTIPDLSVSYSLNFNESLHRRLMIHPEVDKDTMPDGSAPLHSEAVHADISMPMINGAESPLGIPESPEDKGIIRCTLFGDVVDCRYLWNR
jgi:hypothetical protein